MSPRSTFYVEHSDIERSRRLRESREEPERCRRMSAVTHCRPARPSRGLKPTDLSESFGFAAFRLRNLVVRGSSTMLLYTLTKESERASERKSERRIAN